MQKINKKLIAAFVLMASLQAAQLASAQEETWLIPRYNSAQSGTIN